MTTWRGSRRQLTDIWFQLTEGSSMMVVVFRSRLRPGVQDEYGPVAARMSELAATMPGHLAHKTFVAESAETMQAWRMHPEHVEAQRKGRRSFYSEFRLVVCEALRE